MLDPLGGNPEAEHRRDVVLAGDDRAMRQDAADIGGPDPWPGKTVASQVTVSDLQLDHLYVVYRGDRQFPLSKEVTAMPFTELGQTATA